MGKQVKVIASPSTNYRPAMDNTGTGITGTPLGSGAPTKAPSQTIIKTGKGEISKDIEGQQGMESALVPPPASHGSTGPIENGPSSVDYDSQQGTRIPADIGVAQHRIIIGEQDQQLQDKAGG
jgi:hypothetical protein